MYPVLPIHIAPSQEYWKGMYQNPRENTRLPQYQRVSLCTLQVRSHECGTNKAYGHHHVVYHLVAITPDPTENPIP